MNGKAKPRPRSIVIRKTPGGAFVLTYVGVIHISGSPVRTPPIHASRVRSTIGRWRINHGEPVAVVGLELLEDNG